MTALAPLPPAAPMAAAAGADAAALDMSMAARDTGLPAEPVGVAKLVDRGVLFLEDAAGATGATGVG